jgi:hypothetical protein
MLDSSKTKPYFFTATIALSSIALASLAWPKEATNIVAPLKEYASKVHIEEQIRSDRAAITRELNDVHRQANLDDQQKARRVSLQSKLVKNSTVMKYHLQSKVETLRNVKLKPPHHALIPSIIAVNETRIAAYGRIAMVEGLLYGDSPAGVTADSLVAEFEQAMGDLNRAEQEMMALRSRLAWVVAHNEAGLNMTSADRYEFLAFLDLPPL